MRYRQGQGRPVWGLLKVSVSYQSSVRPGVDLAVPVCFVLGCTDTKSEVIRESLNTDCQVCTTCCMGATHYSK